MLASPSCPSAKKEIYGLSLAEAVHMIATEAVDGMSWSRGTYFQDWWARSWWSAAGEWLLWFALGGGPPTLRGFLALPVVGSAGPLPGGGGSARQRVLCRFVFLRWFVAVDDHLFGLTCGVSPHDQLVQVVPVGLRRGPP